MAAAKFRHDAEAHRYWLGNRQIASVNDLLRGAGIDFYGAIPVNKRQKVMMRGRAIHLALQYFDEGDLDQRKLHPTIAGHVKSWEELRNLHDFKLLAIEKPICSERLMIAGRPDRIVDWKRGRKAILEIKSSVDPSDLSGLETAGYETILGPKYGKLLRIEVRTRANGDPARIRFLEDPTDKMIFTTCLTLHHWKLRHKLT